MEGKVGDMVAEETWMTMEIQIFKGGKGKKNCIVIIKRE